MGIAWLLTVVRGNAAPAAAIKAPHIAFRRSIVIIAHLLLWNSAAPAALDWSRRSAAAARPRSGEPLR
jgi:hypothetical protein